MKDGQTATYEPIRPKPKQTEPSMVARISESCDNRGCFHAASVLTTFLIGSFWAELQPPTLLRTPHGI
jgi:hypothetical protein